MATERDPLFDILIGVDEENTSALINQQLSQIATTIKDIQVKINIDDSTFKKAREETKKLAADMKNATSGKSSSGGNIGPGKIDTSVLKFRQLEEETIQRLIASYAGYNATVSKVMWTDSGEIKGAIVQIEELDKSITQITHKVGEDGKLNQTGSITVDKLSDSLKKSGAAASTAMNLYQKLSQQQLTSPDSLAIEERKRDLYKQVEGTITEMTNSIRDNITMSKTQKETQQSVVNELQKENQARKATADGLDREKTNRAQAEQAVKSYKKELGQLEKLYKGGNTGKSADEHLAEISRLEKLTGGYRDLETQVKLAHDEFQRGSNAMQVSGKTKEFEQAIAATEAYAKSLKTVAERYQEDAFKGDTRDMEISTAAIQANGDALAKSALHVDKLGNELKELGVDRSADVSRTQGMVASQDNLNKMMTMSSGTVEELNAKFGQLLQTTSSGKGIEQLADEISKGNISAEEFTKTLKGQNATLEGITSSSNNFNRMTKVITITMDKGTKTAKTYKYTVDGLDKTIRGMESSAYSTGKAVGSFSARLTEAAKKIATWGLSTKIVYGTWRAFKEGVKVVQELDTQLTQIAVVQGGTRKSTQELGEQYGDTALKMAKTVQEVAALNTELVRQGLSLEDSAARANTIMMLSSTGMVSMEQSLQVITSGVNALGETHEKVADVILKASALTASDVEGLGEAFTKTASGAKAAGLSIEETTALLATMKDITQEGDSQLGTSLKSMLARFSKINEETGETNEALNEVQTAIESVGVQFVDSEGQIRSFYDILQDLSGEWDGLDKNTKAYIATQAAGVRQQNRFYAIMDNFNRVQALNNDLTDSAGTVQNAYATYMDSSEAASKRLSAAIQNMWVGFIDSDIVIRVTNTATAFVKLADKVGLFTIVLGAMTAKMLATSTGLKGLYAATKAMRLAELNKDMKGFYTAMEMASAAGVKTTGSVTSFSQALKIAGTNIKATGSTLMSLAPTLLAYAAIGAAIGVAITMITKYIAAQRAARAEEEEFKRVTLEMYGSQNTAKLNLEELGDEYLELEKKVRKAGGTYGLTKEELERYYDVQKQISEQLPDLAYHEDMYGNKILENVGNVQELTAAYDALLKKRIEETAKTYEKDSIDAEKKARKDGGTTKLKAAIAEAAMNLSHLKEELAIFESEGIENFRVDDIRKEITDLQDFIAASDLELIRIDADAVAAGLVPVKLKLIEQLGGISEELNLMMQQQPLLLKLSGMRPEEKVEFLASLQKDIDDSQIKINFRGENVNVDGIVEKLRTLGAELQNGLIDQAQYDAVFKEIVAGFEEMADSGIEGQKVMGEAGLEMLRGMKQEIIETAAETAEEIATRQADSLEKASEAYVKAGEAAKQYQDHLDMLNDAKTTSTQIEDMILDNYPQWAYMMGDKVALSEAFQNAMIAEDQVRRESYINMLLNTGEFTQQTGGAYQQLMAALADYYDGDISNYAELESVKARISEKLINELSDEWAKYFRRVGNSIQLNYGAMRNDLQNRVIAGQMTQQEMHAILASAEKNAAAMNTQFSTIVAAFDKFESSINIPDFSGFAKDLKAVGSAGKKAGKGASSAAKGADKAAEAAKKAAEAIKEMNEQMKGIQDATKDVFDFALEYIEHIKKKQIDATKEAFEVAEKLAEEEYKTILEGIDKRQDEELAILQTKEDALKLEKEAVDYANARREIQDDLANLEYKSAIASLDNSAAGASKRKTLEEEIANRRKDLETIIRERAERLQTEAFARQRQFIQDQADWERDQAEKTKNKKIEDAKKLHDKEMAFLEEKYSAENNYLAARQAAQTGMIKNLHGDMIPLVQAFKELAIENGNFWTFFGQQEVSDFGTRVGNVMKYVKDLGFDTIQTWKAVKEAVDAATSAASKASSSGGSSSGISSGTAPAKSKPVAAPSTPAPKTQTQINREFQSWMQDQMGRVGLTKPRGFAVDGSYGPATRAAATLLQNKNVNTHSKTEELLAKAAQSTSIPESSLLSLKKYGIKIPAANTGGSSASKNTYMAYAQGGKIDYTGPASVHGSKSKPEYVFNYPQFKDLARMIAQHQFTAPKVAVATGRVPTLTIDNFIRVDGNIDKDSLPEFKRASQDAITQLANKLRGMGK